MLKNHQAGRYVHLPCFLRRAGLAVSNQPKNSNGTAERAVPQAIWDDLFMVRQDRKPGVRS